jgi:hypothetical protein
MQTGGREGQASIERVRSMMRYERRLVPSASVERNIGSRVVGDEPVRTRSRGHLTLVPDLEVVHIDTGSTAIEAA